MWGVGWIQPHTGLTLPPLLALHLTDRECGQSGSLARGLSFLLGVRERDVWATLPATHQVLDKCSWSCFSSNFIYFHFIEREGEGEERGEGEGDLPSVGSLPECPWGLGSLGFSWGHQDPTA